MHELLKNLGPGSRVLDLGCDQGSFAAGGGSFSVVRVDLERAAGGAGNFVQADAARLPFMTGCFDAIVSNHSLEHFDDLQGALAEVRRVLKPDGNLYVAVPDASTVSDRLYRWLARGGGHVNAFRSSAELAGTIERATGLRHLATRTLCTSLSCFHRKNQRTRAPRRMWLIGGGTQISLLLLSYVFRLSDRWLGTRTSVYGWAFYFGSFDGPIDCRTWTNVCIRCGSGHASNWLRERGLVRRRVLLRAYRCPGCGTFNLFTEDRDLS